MPHVDYIRADIVKRLPSPSAEADDMNNYDRDIGRLEAVVSSLEKQNDELKGKIENLHSEIAEIKGLILQIKGGSKVLFWLGGLVSGAGGAALFKYLPLLFAR